MRAVWYERTGPAREVLVVGEQPAPHAGPGEVRVRLQASGVNPADCNRRGGRGYAMEYPLVIPNSDGAGLVDEVGDGVDPALLGRRVWLYNAQRGRAFGTAAEWVALDAGLVAPLPDALSYEQGACLGIPGMTAWHCLHMDGPVAGKTVLVQGGAGAVGHFAVQLAHWGGARVLATVRGAEKGHIAKAAGAAAVIDLHDEDLVARVLELTDGAGVDRVIEVDFGGNLAADLSIVAANGVIAAYASRGEPTPKLPFYELMRRNITVHAVLLPGTPPAARQAAQAGIGTWLASGRAQINIAAVFALQDTALAHLAVESGSKRGTVVVRCA
jgi:NADPH2:quinone reductase